MGEYRLECWQSGTDATAESVGRLALLMSGQARTSHAGFLKWLPVIPFTSLHPSVFHKLSSINYSGLILKSWVFKSSSR